MVAGKHQASFTSVGGVAAEGLAEGEAAAENEPAEGGARAADVCPLVARVDLADMGAVWTEDAVWVGDRRREGSGWLPGIADERAGRLCVGVGEVVACDRVGAERGVVACGCAYEWCSARLAADKDCLQLVAAHSCES